MLKDVKPTERISAIIEKSKNRDNGSKKRKKHKVNADTSELRDINYIEELKTQLTYGDTGHGIILDKKV